MRDDALWNVVVDINKVASAMGTQALLVGAYARDLCLSEWAPPTRGTNDADFAVALRSWDEVDRFFASSATLFRDIDPAELLMYHRATGLKVDVVPCGSIEAPPGTLELRGSQRKLNTTGLAACFRVARPFGAAVQHVLVPPPAGFLVLKLLAFGDRRAPRDLRDFGHVLHAHPVDEDALWADDALMGAFAAGTVVLDDVRFWQAGRTIAASFPAEVTDAVVVALDRLFQEATYVRTLILEAVDPDERIRRADRALVVFRRGCLGRTD